MLYCDADTFYSCHKQVVLSSTCYPFQYSSECILVCEECGLDPDNPCNIGKAPLELMVKLKRTIDTESRQRMKGRSGVVVSRK